MDFAFILKKFVSAFLMPLSFSLILAFIGLLFLYFSSYKKAKIFLSLSFLLTFLFSYSPISNFLLKPLESKYEILEDTKDVKYILLLGGDFENRAYEVLRLYNKIPNAKIITSGYKGSLKQSEAIINKNRLIALGIKADDIFMQKQPKDTQEEARNIRNIVKDENFILVTSSYHMQRAMNFFKEEGLNPLAAPSEVLYEEGKLSSVPGGYELLKTQIALHEYLGLAWQKIKFSLSTNQENKDN